MHRVPAVLVLVATLFTALAALVAPGSAAAARAPRTVEIAVTRNGFEPATVRLASGQPVRLVVTRRVERTCATDLVIRDLGIAKPLPLNQPVVVAFTPKRAGTLRYACAMDMVAGRLVVE